MLKELIQETEPLVYEALVQALKNDAVSHAYLFAGPAGTPKKEAAYLLAMSLFCREDGILACETCESCRHTMRQENTDFIVLDGNEKAVSKEDVDALQAGFARASDTGRRVALIDHMDDASIQAQNSLLKFLEEPGEQVTIILTCDSLGKILPTIISRCRTIQFVRLDPGYYEQKAAAQGVNADDAYFLSHLVKKPDGLKEESEAPSYTHAVDMLRQSLGDNGPFEELLADYDISYKLSDRAENLKLIRNWLNLLVLYSHDHIAKNARGPAWYRKLSAEDSRDETYDAKRLIIVKEQLDKANKYNDQTLLMAECFGRLKELKKNGQTH